MVIVKDSLYDNVFIYMKSK